MQVGGKAAPRPNGCATVHAMNRVSCGAVAGAVGLRAEACRCLKLAVLMVEVHACTMVWWALWADCAGTSSLACTCCNHKHHNVPTVLVLTRQVQAAAVGQHTHQPASAAARDVATAVAPGQQHPHPPPPRPAAAHPLLHQAAHLLCCHPLHHPLHPHHCMLAGCTTIQASRTWLLAGKGLSRGCMHVS